MPLPTTPVQNLDSYRKSDAVFIVCQNNTRKIVEIAALNEEAKRATGYQNDDVVGHSLSIILPERISTAIDESIEYEANQKDLQEVLNKISAFAIKKRDGKEVPFKLRIVSGESLDRNPLFHLVLTDEEKVREANAFRSMIRENFKGHEVIDPRTQMPDRNSLIKDIELLIFYVNDKSISASFAVVDINDYDAIKAQYGEQVCNDLHTHIGRMFRQKLRAEDTVGTLSERTLGVLLVGASQEEARMVFNRLRWALGVNSLRVKNGDLTPQVNISFSQIDGRSSQQEVLEKCESYMLWQRDEMDNSLQLVVTHERRDVDRRKQDIPVAHDRRIKDRRTGRGRASDRE